MVGDFKYITSIMAIIMAFEIKYLKTMSKELK